MWSGTSQEDCDIPSQITTCIWEYRGTVQRVRTECLWKLRHRLSTQPAAGAAHSNSTLISETLGIYQLHWQPQEWFGRRFCSSWWPPSGASWRRDKVRNFDGLSKKSNKISQVGMALDAWNKTYPNESVAALYGQHLSNDPKLGDVWCSQILQGFCENTHENLILSCVNAAWQFPRNFWSRRFPAKCKANWEKQGNKDGDKSFDVSSDVSRCHYFWLMSKIRCEISYAQIWFFCESWCVVHLQIFSQAMKGTNLRKRTCAP